MADFNYIDIGLKDYKVVWDQQEQILAEVIAEKRETKQPTSKNQFILVEHPHVYTLGKSGDEKNLLAQSDFLEKMEDAIIATIAEYGLKGGRKEGATGVWLDWDHPSRTRKICAIGVRVSRYVTMHGFALNVNTDMRYFSYINPCGLTFGVTSIQQELGKEISMDEVKEILKEKFNRVY
jgi:lipoyl(octanoyl) transferase